MKKENIFSTIVVSLTLLIFSFIVSFMAVFAWFNGQGYIGKTMSYTRNLRIGSTSSELENYYGYMDSSQNFIYTEIDPVLGFEYNNLIPSSYIHLRTDITNPSLTSQIIISLYLQNIIYDQPLNDFLYFGTSSPIYSKETYKNESIYNEQTNTSQIKSVPLVTRFAIEAAETVSLYWFVHIDSDAGMEVANANIALGQLVLTYNS